MNFIQLISNLIFNKVTRHEIGVKTKNFIIDLNRKPMYLANNLHVKNSIKYNNPLPFF